MVQLHGRSSTRRGSTVSLVRVDLGVTLLAVPCSVFSAGQLGSGLLQVHLLSLGLARTAVEIFKVEGVAVLAFEGQQLFSFGEQVEVADQ